MPGTPTVAQARLVARRLLEPLGDRWAHVCAVASTARQLSPAVDQQSDRDLLVAAAWLHDVGYAPDARCTGCHQIDGAAYLDRQGFDERLCALVAHHSAAVFEAAERGLSDELANWRREESPVADALWTADMTTGPRGEILGLGQRLADIRDRYDPGSTVARAVTAAEPSIRGAVDRTTQRVARSQAI